MDPQKLSQLDPKLRDVYQRVMGTAIPKSQTNSAPQMQTPPDSTPVSASTPQSAPASQPTSITAPPASGPAIQSQKIASEPEPSLKPQSTSESQPGIISQPEAIPPQQASNFTQMNSEVPTAPAEISQNFTAPAPQTQTMSFKKKRGIIMPILFGIAGLVLVTIYTLFWTKIFNLKLPFLPQ